ncbi:MAG: hypothetical protein U0234_07875 [Sandaracinus sp.]
MRARENVVARLFSLLALAAVATPVVGCDVPYDAQRRDGGAAPDPLGVIEGDVLYVGPRPACVRTESGEAVRVAGNVILLLFDYDNPPPPTGSASSAQNLYTMNGSSLFNLSDCMPESPTAADLEPIMRSGHYVWPRIDLATGPALPDGSLPVRDYQIRGFYDSDGDFNPFFSIRNLATAGDVGGGAVVDAQDPIPVFRHVTFHHVDSPGVRELGEHIGGVAVALGAVIDTERPMFVVDAQTQALESDATIPLVADPIAQEEALFQLATMHFSLVRSGDQLDVDTSMGTHPWQPALAAAGILYDFRPSLHGMPVQPVDADGNGFGDPHPILGSNGVDWYTPIVLMQRARNAHEVLAGIPDVLLIGSVRPTAVAGAAQGFVARETFSSADVLVPPVAVVVTSPAQPVLCRVPFIPPGNVAEIYEAQRSECQELPTGNYDVNVLAGVAGARVVDIFEECLTTCVAGGTDEATCTPGCRTEAMLRSDTGYRYQGGSYSSQAWSIPNELGCPDLAYHPTAINQLDRPRMDGTLPQCAAHDVPAEGSVELPSQSRQGTFSVVDPDGGDAPTDVASTAEGRGVAACTSVLHTSGPLAGMTGPIDRSMQAHVPAQCCEPVRHLCGLPLCPLRDAASRGDYPEAVRDHGGVRQTREMRVEGEDYRVEPDGSVTPLCVPFLMPVDCCAAPAT